MDKLTRHINFFLEKFLVFLMAVIVLDVTWQILSRFIMKNPSSFTEELAGFLLMWIGLLGGSYAYFKRAHLGIDIFTSRLEGKKKCISEITISIIIFLFSLTVLFCGGIRLVTITFALNQISPSLKLSMGYIYFVLPLSGLLMMYYSFGFIVHASQQIVHLKNTTIIGK
jgi:TRAP-type C4-dicarboxylate transport system permease small subunit